MSEFEKILTDHGFYFESPSFFIPGSSADAEGYNAEQLIDILAHEPGTTGNLRRMVRKRSEQMGTISYYFKDERVTEYFKVVVPVNATTQGGLNMEFDIPEWAQNIAMHAVSGFLLGFSATFVAKPDNVQDLQTAIYGAAVVGLYGAFKEVLAYLQTRIKPTGTKAGPAVAAEPAAPGKKLLERML